MENQNGKTIPVQAAEENNKLIWLYPKILGGNPPERWGHSGCYAEGKLYIYGGCRGGVHFSDVLMLDLGTMSWRSLISSGLGPGILDSHTAVLLDCKMIIFGGTNGSKKTDDIHILDLETLAWTRPIVQGAAPDPRESHTATLIISKQVLIFGGSGEGEGNYLNDVHILDFESMKWTSPAVKGNLPARRDSHTAVVVGDQLVVYGGDCGDRYLGDLDVLDLCTFTWSKLDTVGSTQPGVRAGHAAVAVGMKMYVFGGVGDRTYYNDVWVLDVKNRTWTQAEIGNMQPQGRFSHVAAFADDNILIYGGCGEDERPLDEFLVLHLLNGQFNRGMWKFFGNDYDVQKIKNKDQRRVVMGRTRRHPVLSHSQKISVHDNLVARSRSHVSYLRKGELALMEVEKGSGSTPRKLSSSGDLPKDSIAGNCTLSMSVLDVHESNDHVKRRKRQDLRSKPEGSENDDSSVSESEQEATRSSVFAGSIQQEQRNAKPPPLPCNAHLCSLKGEHVLHVPTVQLQVHIPSHQASPVSQPHFEAQNAARTVGEIRKHPISGIAVPSNSIGAEVHGIVDGVFDSGYLMTAQLNGQVFRGVLFNPGVPDNEFKIHYGVPVAPHPSTFGAPASLNGTIVSHPTAISNVQLVQRVPPSVMPNPAGVTVVGAQRASVEGAAPLEGGKWVWQQTSNANFSAHQFAPSYSGGNVTYYAVPMLIQPHAGASAESNVKGSGMSSGKCEEDGRSGGVTLSLRAPGGA